MLELKASKPVASLYFYLSTLTRRSGPGTEDTALESDAIRGDRHDSDCDTASEHSDDQNSSTNLECYANELTKPGFIKQMECFMLGGDAFTYFLHRIYCQAIRPEYLGLTRVLLSIPTDKVKFCHQRSTAWVQQIQCFIEQRSTGLWNWWPLPSPNMAVWPSDTRIQWTCVSTPLVEY